MIVGGTGQYITALIEGWQIPEVEPNPELRAELEAYAEEYGWEGLLERLREVDPVHAEQVDARNLRRVIRAIEVSVESGRPYSDFRVKHPPPYTVLELGLTLERDALYERADRRVDQMLDAGLVAEVERLVEAGYGWNLPSMSSLGYLQIGSYLQGKMTLNEAREDLCNATHHFIRRQYTWFRKYNADAIWFESNAYTAQSLLTTIQGWLGHL
jgi:tRNA dimethylallyltransferase